MLATPYIGASAEKIRLGIAQAAVRGLPHHEEVERTILLMRTSITAV
jgi:hypothetical protein